MTDIFPTAFSIGDGMPVRRGKPNRVIALPAHFQPQHLPILTRSTNQSMRHILRQREDTGTIEEQGHVTGWIWMAYFPTVKIQLISNHPDTQRQ